MFSIIFPGQGSQSVGMAKELYKKYDIFKKHFKEANKVLNFDLTNLILEGPAEKLNLTQNTQPSIFLVSYCIFKVSNDEFGIDLSKAKYFAGHSLGEYTALTCANAINFSDTLTLLSKRGKAMQEAVPDSKGGMLAILGSDLKVVEDLLNENEKKYKCYIANDNSLNQIVVSGYLDDIDKFSTDLKAKKIKNIKLPVSAPFHCKLMREATLKMSEELDKVNIKDLSNPIVSNVTANEVQNKEEIRNLLKKQIESRVRWRESINYILKKNIYKFIEIGPGKIQSNLIKRFNNNININSLNSEDDIKNIEIND